MERIRNYGGIKYLDDALCAIGIIYTSFMICITSSPLSELFICDRVTAFFCYIAVCEVTVPPDRLVSVLVLLSLACVLSSAVK